MNFFLCWLKILGAGIAIVAVASLVVYPLCRLGMWLEDKYGSGWALAAVVGVMALLASLMITAMECGN